MSETVRFGRIAGITIGANWSVLIIAWLLAFGLAVEALPELAPGYGAGWYWVVAIAAALVFFCSLLAHEMAHALVARSAGLPVEGITLWALGGVSKLGGDAPSAAVELRIAIVGPLTSFAVGSAFVVLSLLGDAVGASDLTIAAFVWLGTINILLGLFNLAPAFPLDGGRVLRAALWWWRGDRLWATSGAAAAGRVFGYLLVGGGVLLFMAGGVVDGLWLVLLGWFVLNLASAELAQVEQHELLAGVRIAAVMTASPLCVPSDIDLDSLLHGYVLTHRHSSYPVVDDEHRLLGLVTLDSIRRVPPERRAATPVLGAAVRAADVPTASPGELVEAVIPRLATSSIGRVVVVEAGRVVGLVSHSDVVSCLERRSLTRTTPAPR